MRQSTGDWFRYAQSGLLQVLPGLAPRPVKPDAIHPYRYTLPAASEDDFSFVLVGDTGMNSPGQYQVASALSHRNIYPSDFCMILGDVTYPAGSAESYRYGLLEAFRHYDRPVLAIPGNHDWYDRLHAFRKFFIRGEIPGALARQYDWQSPRLPNWYFYMDVGSHLRIICLDTGLTGDLSQNRSQQLAWLDGLLETSGSRKVVLMMHHPLYSLSGRPHETALRKILLPRLRHANVVAVFAGHDHNYQRHEIEGCQHIIQGAGGATLHPLPDSRMVRLDEHGTGPVALYNRPGWDRQYSFTHCRWQNGQLTCTTVSAHELPGRILDRFVI